MFAVFTEGSTTTDRSERGTVGGRLELLMLLIDYFNDHHLPNCPRIRSKATRSLYRCLIRSLELYLQRAPTLDDLNKPTLVGFLHWYGQERAPRTVNKQRGFLLAMWRQASEDELITSQPRKLPVFPTDEVEVTAWTVAEVGLILGQIRRLDYLIGDIKAKHWWKALVLSLYDTGCRISAMMAARLDDYYAQTGILRVRGETQKTGKAHLVLLSAQTRKALSKLPDDRELMFPWPYDRTGWATLIRHYRRRILKPAGLPHGPRDLFHKFRRTTATELAAVAGDDAAQRQLQHSSLAMTERYLDPSRRDVTHAAQVLPRPKAKTPRSAA